MWGAPFIVDDFERSLTAYRKKGNMWLQKPLFTLDDDRLVLMTTENRPGVFWSFMEQKTRVFRAWRRTLALRSACAALPRSMSKAC